MNAHHQPSTDESSADVLPPATSFATRDGLLSNICCHFDRNGRSARIHVPRAQFLPRAAGAEAG